MAAIVLTVASAQQFGRGPTSAPTFPAGERARMVELGSRDVRVHDPSTIVKCKDEYWVFYTGNGVPSYHSRDLVKWERGPAVFKAAPEWIAKVVPENRYLQYWAPDIIKLGD